MNFIAALRKVTESIRDWVEARVTSWNDLTDRPFGEEVVETVLVDTVLQIPDPEDSGVGCGFVREHFNFKEGQTYTVTWDGVKHDCVAFKDNSNETWLSTFENRIPDSEEVPDGHVLIDNNNKDSMCNFWLYVWGTNGEHTLKIEQTFETVTPIDEKYLPESVVDIVATIGEGKEEYDHYTSVPINLINYADYGSPDEMMAAMLSMSKLFDNGRARLKIYDPTEEVTHYMFPTYYTEANETDEATETHYFVNAISMGTTAAQKPVIYHGSITAVVLK